jgi:hypothetical protein
MTGSITSNIVTLRAASAPVIKPAEVFTRTFTGKPGEPFSAINEAQGFLASRGFSFGPGCSTDRVGILFGRGVFIAKWRNLTPMERAQCHGVIEGPRRTGPVTVRIFFTAPAFAIAAVASPEVADAIVTAWSNQR